MPKINIKSKKIIILLIFFVLLTTPLIFGGKLYFVGGDDTRLFYIYPDEYLNNFVFNLASGNTLAGANTGYNTVAYFAPFFYVIKLLKIIPLNTQYLMYGMNLAFGFLFFYKFIEEYFNIKNENYFTIKIITSLFYISSPFLVTNLYKNSLISVYLVSIIPISLYFFVKGLKTNSYIYSLISVLLFSIFSTTLNVLPWFAGFLIASLPLFVFYYTKNNKVFLKHTLFILLLFVILNFYWLFHFVNSNIFGAMGSLSYYNSQDFVSDNARIASFVYQLHNPLNIIFYQGAYPFSDIFRLPKLLYVVLFSIVILGIFVAEKFVKLNRKHIIIAGFGFLFSWFLFSPNFGDWSRDVFVNMSKYIPFFSMFRNMQGKFALPLSFYFSLCLFSGLVYLADRFKKTKWIKVPGGLFVTFLLLINLNQLYRVYSGVENDKYKISGVFNRDFEDLINYFKSNNDHSKILWLPLNYPTYLTIEDKISDHYYFGPSPLQILVDRQDYTGKFSFITQNDFFAGDNIFELINDGNFDEVGKIFQQLNVKYVVVDNSEKPEERKNFLYGGDGLPLLEMQNDDYYRTMLGDEITNFGERYKLYYINNKFKNEKVILTSDVNEIFSTYQAVGYRKIDSEHYSLEFKNGVDKYLIFLESYSPFWKLTLADKHIPTNAINANHFQVFGYANGWDLSKIQDDLQGDLRLELIFTPADKYLWVGYVSFLGYVISFFVVSYKLMKRISQD